MTRFTKPVAALFVVLLGVAACTQTAPSSQPMAAAPAATQKATARGTWTVATYNIRNFFDTYDNPYTKDEGTTPKTKADLESLAAALKAVDADVVVLEEVEAGGFLKQYNKEYLADLHYKYVIDTVTEDPRGITVAVLSRFPVKDVVSHRFTELVEGVGPRPSNEFARDVVRVDLRVRPDYAVSIFGVHLKSKLNTDGDKQSNAWRLREANRLVAILDDFAKANPTTPFLICGDFNDTLESAPVQKILTGTHPPLADTLAGVTPRVTFKDTKYIEAIDNIFVSPLLEAELAGPAKSFDGGPFEVASDHRPVKATFRVP